MLFAAPKPDKRARFDAALAEMSGDSLADATTPKKRPVKKVVEASTDAAAPTPTSTEAAAASDSAAPAEDPQAGS